MKRRMVFYLFYLTIAVILGFLVQKFSSEGKISLLMVLTISLIPQYLLSFFILKLSLAKSIGITLVSWLVSFGLGLLILVYFGFNRKEDPSQFYGIATFFVSIILCYEIYSFRNRKI
jgi:Kef-type K+ transport system membrane component KefB